MTLWTAPPTFTFEKYTNTAALGFDDARYSATITWPAGAEVKFLQQFIVRNGAARED